MASQASRRGRHDGRQQRGSSGRRRAVRIGVFGAWVWFWQQADGFWEHLLAILEGLFWPAFMVYQVFDALHR